MRRRLSTILSVATIVLGATCVLELGSIVAMRHVAAVYRAGQAFAVPSGYLLNGTYLRDTPASCFVIRVTADSCPYCQRDREPYTQLARQASLAGCRVIAVAPRAGQMAPNPLEPGVQLQYVDMKVGRTLNPFMTPQTIVLDGRGRMAWQRQGAMDMQDVGEALSTLDAMRKESSWH